MSSLFNAAQQFAALALPLPDGDLNRPWKWGEYDEGIRFAFFRVHEELCQLAARLEAQRSAADPLTTAQRIMGQYHAAYLDLQAVLLGVSDELAAQRPAEGEWPLREVLSHIVQAERGFFTANHFGLDSARRGEGAFEMTEVVWNDFWADMPFAELSEKGTLTEIQAYHARLHPRILNEFANVTADELHVPVRYWEETLMPLEFRLHRFHSHMRQHTIQAEKTLAMLGQPPSEAQRLLRMVYGSLSAVESAALGVETSHAAEMQATAGRITALTQEIAELIGSTDPV